MSSIPANYQEGIWSITPHTIDADFPEGRQSFEVRDIEYIKLQSVMENGQVVCNAYLKVKVDSEAHFIGCYTESQGTMCHVLARFSQSNHIQMLTDQDAPKQKSSDGVDMTEWIKHVFDPANPNFKKTMIILGVVAFVAFAGLTGIFKGIQVRSISGPSIIIIYFLLRFFRSKAGEKNSQRPKSENRTEKPQSWMPSRDEDELRKEDLKKKIDHTNSISGVDDSHNENNDEPAGNTTESKDDSENSDSSDSE